MLDIVTSSPGFRLYQARSLLISLILAEKTVPPYFLEVFIRKGAVPMLQISTSSVSLAVFFLFLVFIFIYSFFR